MQRCLRREEIFLCQCTQFAVCSCQKPLSISRLVCSCVSPQIVHLVVRPFGRGIPGFFFVEGLRRAVASFSGLQQQRRRQRQPGAAWYERNDAAAAVVVVMLARLLLLIASSSSPPLLLVNRCPPVRCVRRDVLQQLLRQLVPPLSPLRRRRCDGRAVPAPGRRDRWRISCGPGRTVPDAQALRGVWRVAERPRLHAEWARGCAGGVEKSWRGRGRWWRRPQWWGRASSGGVRGIRSGGSGGCSGEGSAGTTAGGNESTATPAAATRRWWSSGVSSTASSSTSRKPPTAADGGEGGSRLGPRIETAETRAR